MIKLKIPRAAPIPIPALAPADNEWDEKCDSVLGVLNVGVVDGAVAVLDTMSWVKMLRTLEPTEMTGVELRNPFDEVVRSVAGMTGVCVLAMIDDDKDDESPVSETGVDGLERVVCMARSALAISTI